MKRVLFAALILALAACGEAGTISRDLTGRIVGGVDTTIEEYPHQVSLVYVGSHRCGGAIISENYVLTAAHCVYSIKPAYISYLKVRVGSSYRTSGGTLHSLSSFTYHSSFSSSTYVYDIALLKLASPLLFGTTIQPIELPSTDYTLPDGTLLSVTGWGTTSYGGTSASVLQLVEVPLMNNTYCAQLYSDYSVTSTMVCAGYDAGGKDACQGDSGGPLIYGNVLVGLVSWGEGCAYASSPGVYARVSALRSWVEENTGLQFD